MRGNSSYLSRYFVGNITRKGVNSLLTGRALALLLKAFLVYVLYLLADRLATPENVWRLSSRWMSRAREIYEGMMTIRPHLLPLATRSTLLMVLAAVFPYGSVYLLDCWQRHRVRRNARRITA